MSNAKQEEAIERWGDVIDSLPDRGSVPENALAELEAVRTALVAASSDPLDTGDIRFSPHGFVVCFESQEQKDELLQAIGMYQYGDKYIMGPDMCLVLGVDLEKGTINPQKAKASGLKFSFGQNLKLNGGGLKPMAGFGKQKKEVGETLKNIREDEKQTAKYIAWTSNTEYWFFVTFWKQEDAERFLSIIGIEADRGWARPYVWCREFAAALGVELTPCTFKDRSYADKRDAKLCSLVREKLEDFAR